LHDPFSQAQIQKVDKGNVLGLYRKWPDLAQEGLDVDFDPPKKKFWRVVVLGMGGSAAGGDILTGWVRRTKKYGEMAVCKGHIPFHDLSDSLTIAYSVSGKTRETISMMKTAVSRGGTVVSISSGGPIVEASEKLGVPHVEMPMVLAPRYVLPFVLFSCLAIADRALELGSAVQAASAVRGMREVSREIDQSGRSFTSPAKKLGAAILGRIPSIYGTQVTRGAAVRFKNVLNENAKILALADVMPELFHNEIESWEYGSKERVPVFLRNSLDEASDGLRADKMIELLSKKGLDPVEWRGRGTNSFSELATLVYELDLASYYVAIGLGRNPLPTTLIDQLKNA
jgi:glucose/mannose-6-phosphate isomerase